VASGELLRIGVSPSSLLDDGSMPPELLDAATISKLPQDIGGSRSTLVPLHSTSLKTTVLVPVLYKSCVPPGEFHPVIELPELNEAAPTVTPVPQLTFGLGTLLPET